METLSLVISPEEALLGFGLFAAYLGWNMGATKIELERVKRDYWGNQPNPRTVNNMTVELVARGVTPPSNQKDTTLDTAHHAAELEALLDATADKSGVSNSRLSGKDFLEKEKVGTANTAGQKMLILENFSKLKGVLRPPRARNDE